MTAVLLAAAASLQPPFFKDESSALGLTLGNDQACFVDLDRDGWTDLVAGGAVWRNEKGVRFVKIAEGVGQVVAADFDNDGFPDLFSWSQRKLYHSEGGKRFVEFPLPDLPPSVSRGAAWGDWNNDGFVDLYVGGYEDWERQITYPSFILMNRGGRSFEPAWSSADHRTRGVTACDYDRNGGLDIYVSNYRLQPNQLWLNDGKAAFHDGAAERGALATSEGFEGGHSIGAAWGDFDGDGEFDLFAGNFAHVDQRGDQPKSRFLRSLGPSGGWRFEDKGPCGIAYQESFASPAAGDVDNDGRLDLYFTTVYATASFGVANHAVLMRSEGGFKFADATAASGLADQPPTYQAAFADITNAGRLALCTGGRLYGQEVSGGHWLGVRLEGDGKKVNRSAIGAQVRIKLPDRILCRQVEAGTGEGNQNDLRLHFGLGEWDKPVELDILWPGGRKQRVRRVKVDRIVEVRIN